MRRLLSPLPLTLLLLAGFCGCDGTSGALFTPITTDIVPATWPDSTNTGVPDETALTPHTGNLNLTTPGEVVERKEISGCVRIQASNVTLRLSRIRCTDSSLGSAAIRIDSGLSGILLEQLEVDGTGVVERLVYGAGFTARRLDIFGGGEAIQLAGSARVEQSFLHGLTTDNSSVGLSTPGATGVVLEGNRIEGGRSAAIFLSPSGAPIDDVRIVNNLLSGGRFTVYAGSDASDFPTTRVVIQDNVFERNAVFGPHALATGDITWVNNVWSDTGEQVTR